MAAALKVEILKDEQRALAEFPNNPRPTSRTRRDGARWTVHARVHASCRRVTSTGHRAGSDFLAAYLANSDALRSIFAYFEPPKELLPKVEASLEAVLERDPDSAEALSSLGLTQVMAWQWRGLGEPEQGEGA